MIEFILGLIVVSGLMKFTIAMYRAMRKSN